LPAVPKITVHNRPFFNVQITMSASAAAKVKNLEVYYFERKDSVDTKKLLKTPSLMLRKKFIFRLGKLKVTNNAFVFEGKLDHQRHPF